ncbi:MULTISPECIES: 3D-(3,5/4)-trihydroxycyclohexane-1,2-dione acylhydrolase (decyclizing) [unclassified Marinobacterium]|uniref:3D-(3,5/4)-trihydroxycyclohexane-1,2-dione acylhydrolase (decyclizing) n=1 Tax=unclassified Marinobacterium TaxID=2644139 RepID=UPI001568AF29|nr:MULTISPECIES: 3D-(3,5/4)-trihydroxycyclohexane-1,2-dione acylhydrolase (decyclizing) [unclassified Marinobacterium]NRP53293.1 3D-(3,5/4)-trihydroxycyclohexane-1,2-dione hydrolase [Marinobacterium sp. xm-v-242]NRP78078.1 3D-(3,5/4)-trihydroxycyclohexane-1,2-dione hydrolase [Marinobacterium sp. xm-m-383]
MGETVTLTTAQAIIRYLQNQWIDIQGERVRLFGGGFGIFGHGNVTCLGEALYEVKDDLPLFRGQNEQSMGFAAAAYAKYHKRNRIMFCTASAGPGTANLVTSSALAMANRLPMLMLCGDNFATRLPDPVLQQVEHFNNPALGVTDAFKSVTRYWDRITHPAQILQSLPQAIGVMLDPADCGPAFIGLPQDVQGWTFEYPTAFFEPKVHRIRSILPDPIQLSEAAELLSSAKKPLIVAGGGVQYGDAIDELRNFAEQHAIPVVETIAGRANLVCDHPLNCGPLGVTGSDSANAIADQADVVLCVGTRLQDFTTGSWSVFGPATKLIKLNPARHDALKHLGVELVAGAKESLPQLSQLMKSYRAPQQWLAFAEHERQGWADTRATNTNIHLGPNRYAQAIGVVNNLCDPGDRIVTAAGGLPAEVTANWKTLRESTVDVEFGFSCMGYEIAGGWGARIAQSEKEPDQDTIVFVGDGSYLLMNSDIYSSVITEKKLILLVLDNGGFAVINKLQTGKGNVSYNNLFIDTPTATVQKGVDFVQHAQSLGAQAERVLDAQAMQEAFKRAKASKETYVIVMDVDAYQGWTDEGHAWWEVGTPAVSGRQSILDAHAETESGRSRQRKGV